MPAVAQTLRSGHLRLLFLLLKELLCRGVQLCGRLRFYELANAHAADLLIPAQVKTSDFQ